MSKQELKKKKRIVNILRNIEGLIMKLGELILLHITYCIL